MPGIVIVDYGMGNLQSVRNIFRKLGQEALVSADPQLVKNADKLVLPGVGACKVAMRELEQRGLVEAIHGFINRGRPYLGICLGLQLLFEYSEEGGEVKGLGIFSGRVRRFNPGVKVPHMGWNRIKIIKPTLLLKDIKDNNFVYFVHSYYVEPKDKGIVMTTTDYNGEFTSSINQGNIFGTQFHPEKSQLVGQTMIKNFLEV